MKLSVIIICLNEERHLARCLKALTETDHGSTLVEIIVVDGGSKDRSREVAVSYGVKVIDSAKGIPIQRNIGAKAATGDVLAYVDADIEIMDEWFSTIHRHFCDSTRKVLGSNARLPKDASWISRAYALHLGLTIDGLPDCELKEERVLATGSLVMGREVYEEVGGFLENLHVDEDTFFLMEAKRKSIPLICDRGLGYIHHGEPKTLSEFFRRVKWGTNCKEWYRLILQGKFKDAKRRQYIYGAAIAAELIFLVLSIAVASIWGWRLGIVLALSLLTVSFFLPALRTAIQRKASWRLGELFVMYGAYGLAIASAMIGIGWNKSDRWR